MILLFAACGGAVDTLDGSADDITATSWQLFTVQRDERKCAAPMCGGFFATAAQADASPAYVADLDFSHSALDAAAQAMVRAAPAEELMLRAKLSAADKHGVRKLLVKDAYRGMPDIVPAAKDALYSMARSSVATEQMSGTSAKVTDVDVSGAAKPFVDQAWLVNRVEQHAALASAHVAKAVLAASQVFLHLPEVAGPCAKPAEQACSGDEVQAYARTPDRCLQAVGCVSRGICPRMQPACPPGYVAASWTAADGCAATACDPAWVR